tara:strand:- start:11313 stop:14792 length:3480 start_codon:yes stop_codon:yes gene_type:complete
MAEYDWTSLSDESEIITNKQEYDFTNLSGDVIEADIKTAQPKEAEEQEEGTTFFQNIAELPEAAVKGIGSAIKETGEFLESVVPLGGFSITDEQDSDVLKSWQDENGVHLFSVFGNKVAYVKPDEWSDLQALNAANLIDTNNLLPTRDDGLDTPTGQFAAPVVQFIGGFVGAGKFLKPFQATTGAGKVLKATTQGALADAIVFDPHEERLSNLAQHFGIETALTDYLAADPTDSAAEGRFKNAIEGSVVGLTLELVFKLARATKKARDAKKENIAGNTEKAATLMKEVADEIEEAEQLIPKKEDGATYKDEAKIEPSRPEDIRVKGIDEETSIPNTKEALDEATKDARAERGSLRTGEDIITIPVATAVKKGQVLINQLIKDPNFNKGSLLDFVKKLGKLNTDSTFYMGIRGLGDNILDAHNNLVNTAAYKAKDEATVRKANELAEAYRQTYAYHQGLLSDSGRILRYSQEDLNSMPSDLLALDGDALSQAIFNAAKDNPRNAKLRDKFKNKIEQFNEYYVGNLLFSWKTQMTNIMANTLMPLIDTFEQFGGGLIGTVRGDKTQLVDAARQTYGYGKYAGTSMKAGWESLMTAKNVIDPEFKVREEVDGQVDRISVGTKDIDLRKLSWEEARNMPLSDWVGNTFRLSFRGLAAGDEMFKQLTFRSVAYREVVKKFKTEGKFQDVTAKQFDALVEKAVDDVVADAIKMQKDKTVVNPIAETALRRARENTFTEPLKGIGKDVQVLVNKYPALRVVAPFIRTPINIFKWPLRRALPMLSTRQKEAWRQGGAARDRVIFETGYMVTALYLLQQAINEKVTFTDVEGNESEVYRFQSTWSSMSYNAQQNKRLSGVTPHSAYILGKFRSTRRGDPADTIITTLTGIRDLREAGKYAEADELSMAILASFINLAQNKTFMQGVTNFVEAVNSPENFAEAYAEGFARSLSPQIITMFNDDPYYRDAQGLYENFISKVPSLSENLPAKRDILGKPILRPEDGLAPSSLVSNNVVRLEFADIQSSVAQIPEREDNGILNWKDDRYIIGGVSAYDRYSELVGTIKVAGKTLEDRLEALIQSKDYKNKATTTSVFSDATYKGSKEDAILDVITKYRQKAKAQVLKEYKKTGIRAVYEQHQINKKAALNKKFKDRVNTDVDSIIKEYKSNN